MWGASGGEAKGDNLVAEGGLGGHSKGYKKMKKDEVIYVYNGGSPKGTSYGVKFSFAPLSDKVPPLGISPMVICFLNTA